MSPEDEALHGRIREMQAAGALMCDVTAALGVTKEEVWRVCAAYREREYEMAMAARRERYRQTPEGVRLEEAKSAYVDLHEAVRVVVRLMSGGEPLAQKMTDRWITGGFIFWDAPNEASTKERQSLAAEGGRAADGASEVHLRVQPVRDDLTLDERVALMVRNRATTAHITAECGITEEQMWEIIGRLRRESQAEDKPKGDYRVDDRLMCRLYGDDWRTLKPRVFAAFYQAVRVLGDVLHLGGVAGVGVSAAAHEKCQRPIEPHEWASRSLRIRRGMLDTPAGKNRQTHPPILDVLEWPPSART